MKRLTHFFIEKNEMTQYYVYILCNKPNGTLYAGVTSDLIKRIWQHKNKVLDGFSQKYDVDKLVYYEVFGDIKMAITKEKQIKACKRQWKLNIIQKNNPNWNDLYDEITK